MAQYASDPYELRRRAVPWHDQVRDDLPTWIVEELRAGASLKEVFPEMDPNRNHFNAMRSVTRDEDLYDSLTPEQVARKQEFLRIIRKCLDFSPNYNGDTRNERNKSADVPDSQNTSVWLTGLPAGCDTSMLMEAIVKTGKTGKIWASHINNADPRDHKPFAAAKIVFFTRDGADRLMAAVQQGRFRVGGRVPRAAWNRIKSATRPAKDKIHSRVLIIEGHISIVNKESLEEWFKSKFEFQTDQVVQRKYNARLGINVLEWRFGSYRAQAEAAAIAITKELGGKVKWTHGDDPCA
ncbi:hypothetical protein CkaCkLH20_01524 [Colletotrichum karsti]|uniref:Uncharacterized protein n=1 Tax=Colletotrichum karsti TaxID=1095194 RepID=A0A9P6IEI2_9PEZI|nr:uncharacterized protein CkaCkLH20_01524 [Colletotrichum karsti]KAF9881374.1 hypothetical protein CkaCkLH20_01524 [Colletotrichum karsti]